MSKRNGFTLVELLIVVAIMGVLVSLGRVQYSRMVQKARQGEAKSLVGGLASVERAFFGEYGTYGDQIRKVGFDVTAPPSNYVIGFANVGPSTCNNKVYTLPGPGTPNRDQLMRRNSGYFAGPTETRILPTAYVAGVWTCASGTVWDPAGPPNTATGNFFIGSASGIISPKYLAAPEAEITTGYDVWSLGSNGTLTHDFDGVD